MVMSSIILCLLIIHSINVFGISVSRSAALVIRFIPINHMLTRMVQIVVISFLSLYQSFVSCPTVNLRHTFSKYLLRISHFLVVSGT